MRINYNTLLLFFLSVNLWAQGTIKKIDLNKDGIIDRIEYYKNEELVQLKQDRNNDGQIDNITNYNKNGYVKIWEQDSDYNGKYDRKVSEKKISSQKVKIKYEVDKNEDGKFEITYFKTINIDQKLDENCIKYQTQQNLDKFINQNLRLTAAVNNGYLQTDFGYNIDIECLDKWGMNFPKIVKESLDEGLECLMNLDKRHESENIVSGALINSHKILTLLTQKKVTLVCSEQDYNWNGVAGHASSGPIDTIVKGRISHPYISLNPKGPNNKQLPTGDENLQIKRTVFHEQLHNLGYKHYDSIEYPYACGDCCFKRSTNNKKIERTSCKICLGDYKNETDLKYIEDLVAYAKASFNDQLGTSAVIRYMKENPKDIYSLSILAWSSSGVFSSVGVKLAKIIEKEISPIPESSKANLVKARYFRTKKGEESGEIIAQVYYNLYYIKDPSKAVKLLEDNKKKIREEIKSLLSSETEKYIGMELKQHLDDILYDLWVNQYGDEDSSVGSADRAYDVYTFINKNYPN